MAIVLTALRHIQEHASQLSLLLGQRLGAAPDWVSQAETGHRDG
ncbi:MAG: hypothetical protein ACYDCQ_11120 [Dehalococcoidia bacterium]